MSRSAHYRLNSDILLEDHKEKIFFDLTRKEYVLSRFDNVLKKCSLKNLFFAIMIILILLLFTTVILLILRVKNLGNQSHHHTSLLNRSGSVTEIISTSFSTKGFWTQPVPTTEPTTTQSNIPASPHSSKIFISDANQVRVFDLRTNKSSLMHEITEDILTFDVTDASLFYVEKNLPIIQSVYQSHINVTFPNKVHPQAMAVDFLTKKFYIVDKVANTVNVMDFEGENFGIVLSDLQDPHDVVLDIEQGFMFILQFKKSILRANLDGTNLQEIVKDKKVSAMTLDRQKKKIFWAVDEARIVCSNYDGSGRNVSMAIHAAMIKSLFYHDNQLFWLYSSTYSHRRALWTCGIEHGHCLNPQEVPVLLDDPQIVKAYAEINKINNPCEVDNGNCSDFCFAGRSGRVCACRMGYELDSDLQTCKPVTDLILYIQGSHVRAIGVDSKKDDTFKDFFIPTVLNATGKNILVDYDIKNDYFFYHDNDYFKVMNINGDIKPRTIVHCGKCREFNFDWVSGNHYFIEDDHLYVFSYKPNNSFMMKEIENTHKVDKYAISVKTGKIYAVSYSSSPHSYSINTDGTNMKTLSSNYDVKHSKSLTFDNDDNGLYFLITDAVFHKNLIDSFTEVTRLYEVGNAVAIDVNKEFLYAYNSTNIWRVDKKTGKNVSQIVRVEGDEKILGMKVLSAARSRKNGCDVNNCEHFCFAKPRKTCACMDFYQLRIDGSCKSKY